LQSNRADFRVNATFTLRSVTVHVDQIIERLKASQNIRTKKRIGDICGVSIQAVRGWSRVPSIYCRRLELESGGAVTRYEMRPDVFGPAADDDSDLIAA
jgi:CTP synthase (UTP-ammonia lyase)